MKALEKGITFNVVKSQQLYHTYHDFGFLLSEKEIGAATPKTELLDVPGADAPLDFTEFFGDIKYKNRKLKFTLSKAGVSSDFLDLFSEVQNALNGQLCDIILDEDDLFYYRGRVTVSSFKKNKRIGECVIDCDCEPYKMKLLPTRLTYKIAGNRIVSLPNLRKQVIPNFDSDSEIQVKYSGKIFTGSGKFIIPDLVLKKDITQIELVGTATVKIEYVEGSL